MTNNDVLRSVRYILNISETKLCEIIALADFKVSKADLISFLKQEDEEGYKNCGDKVLGRFLDGLVIYKRGKIENDSQQPRDSSDLSSDLTADLSPNLSQNLSQNLSMTNNIILKKLRVAFALKDTDIIHLLEKSGLKISKSELSAIFRKPDHRNYRECGNQLLRNLLRGMAL